ncbi:MULTISPECIES: flagellar basal-body MS-ring/collar protein FliF [unclassified Mesorhizobium]|uniref:flagellar basal-body MS-ring/collar protein FliF n=1 Tax=unclassified Mesorhizobium TaxID=325217 RepID=UPI000FCBC3E3|nr:MULTISPECIES: flagellar basal-body MS-ring/collar protein FliF [unclassified Mesorhizobium]RUU85447.1 flagellar M-ring protein FliF [Mesorhizobium sp. M7A.T.Ca.TU.009.01.1.2]RUT80874.1 flagellar M-ring protein FliF [Mesorhizobium sp. M7A.T.Ca.US.000.02.1.1]RUT92223.1 flagellar M-ring protein FliF [Mesorhizobium sp. M7A.T.Ca.US.000.02.2.1]RWN27406.1 MAG: flagellar M-ring protein FliF [Mesorhizobium sp.]RWO45420.1 MAG: flagellar M-ring protein FliF [Mesorhizobium sp.]
MPEQIQSIISNLRGFGVKRLAMLAGIAVLVMGVIGIASVYLNRPAYDTLYVGLDRADVNQIGLVLGEAGIGFDVGADGTSVLVPAGTTAQARMLLAEKGLPTSANAGYELFDNVGSLGLTSFMQQITRVRALEGEIARTIQSISGIKAARVHIVMSERANFRRDEQQPSASVVIRYAGIDAEKSAMSIRHLVAAAVPGLSADKVTVLDSSGNLLAAGDDPSNTSAARTLGVEQTVEAQIGDNIRRALTAYLGPDNFRASVKAEVNTDTRQTEETIFDPNSRVERSVQSVRANENNNQKQASTPASVEQNLPETQATATDGPQSSSQNDRREEITNYEINSKKIATVSNGYTVTKMSIAVVVNQQRLTAILGKDATPEQIAMRVAEIQKMVTSATGLDEKRGDIIDVSAVEFIDGLDGEAIPQAGMLDSIGQHAGTMINAGAFIVVVFLVAFFGLRPMAVALTAKATPALAGPSFDDVQRSLPTPEAMAATDSAAIGTLPGTRPGPTPLDDLRQKIRPAPQDRLARMVDLNEERTAQILRKWAAQEVAV